MERSRLQSRLSAQQPGLPLRPDSIIRRSWSTGLPSSFSHEPTALSKGGWLSALYLCLIIMGKLTQSTSCGRHMAVTQNTKKWKIQLLFPAPMFSVEGWKLHSSRQIKLPCVGHYCSVSAFLPNLPLKSFSLFIYPSNLSVCLIPFYLYFLKSSCSLSLASKL